jgi:hypothetical protein
LAGIALVALLLPLPASLADPWVKHLLSLGHLPLFAALTFFCSILLSSWRCGGRVTLAFAAGAVTAILVELAQGLVPTREPDLHDLAVGVAGCVLGAAAPVAWQRSRAWRFAVVATICAIGVWMTVSVAATRLADRMLDARMPALGTFDTDAELRRWHAKPRTSIRRVRDPRLAGKWSLQVDCRRGEYPGIAVEDFPPDWSRYHALTWRMFLPGDQPIRLAVRIDDDVASAGTRFTAYLTINPGAGVYRLPFSSGAAMAIPMRFSAIGELHFFLDHPRTDVTFLLADVRLE